VDELGEGTVELMRMIKRAVDPHNLLNPGKASSHFDTSLFGADSYNHVNSTLQLYPNKPEDNK
jgi:hypothetical protein